MQQRQTGSVWVLLITVGVVLVVLQVTGVLAPITNTAQQGFGALQRVFYRQTVLTGNEYFADQSREDLISQILQLQDTVATLEQERVAQDLITEEYTALAQTFEFTSRFDRVTPYSGNIVGLGVEQDPAVFILDIGALDAPLEVGQPVIAPTGVFVGTLVQVEDHRSILRLITHPDAAVTVSTEVEDQPIGVASGQFGLSTKLSLVPKDSSVAPGDVLYTSGIDDHVPQGLVVGVVNTLEDEVNSTFRSGLVDIRFTPGELRVVTVLVENQ